MSESADAAGEVLPIGHGHCEQVASGCCTIAVVKLLSGFGKKPEQQRRPGEPGRREHLPQCLCKLMVWRRWFSASG
ncbi:hypothetical protein ACFQ6B_21265 [Streptomyces wedmorensis]|uniref:Uncharacterized protein n=1 Tax=Streptomyces wedmorensis TaxID=43759 RepID=A0ABW6IMP8_STRWE